MKKLLFTLSLIITSIIFAQEKQQSLEVDYELEIKMEVDQVLSQVPAQYRSQVEAMLREEIKNGIFVDYKLKTNGKESLYKLVEKLNNNQSAAGMIVSQITASDKDPMYKNLTEKRYTKPYSFTNYLVKDSLPEYNWKITREKQNIAGFDAYKANGTISDSIQVTAWYTPKISIKEGPDRFWGLPGLILKAEFEIMNMEMVVTAKNVVAKEEEIEIIEPSKGKTLTMKEFEEEMKKLQEKQKEMMGGGVDTE